MVVYHYNPTSNRNILLELINIAAVVYHYNPTSNRNLVSKRYVIRNVVYHYNPTSNRNMRFRLADEGELYIIIILHQTATFAKVANVCNGCISL